MIVSNAISDAVLCLVCVTAVIIITKKVKALRLRIYLDLFPVLLAVTAFFGMLRFLGVPDTKDMSMLAQYAASTFGVVGLVFGIIYLFESKFSQAIVNLAMGIATIVFFLMIFLENKKLGLIVQGPAIAALAIVILAQFRKSVVIGFSSLIMLILFVGSALRNVTAKIINGTFSTILSQQSIIDMQHYLLSGALLFFLILVGKFFDDNIEKAMTQKRLDMGWEARQEIINDQK